MHEFLRLSANRNPVFCNFGGRPVNHEWTVIRRGLGLFSSKELFFQIRPEFIDQVVNHAKGDSRGYRLSVGSMIA